MAGDTGMYTDDWRIMTDVQCVLVHMDACSTHTAFGRSRCMAGNSAHTLCSFFCDPAKKTCIRRPMKV